MALYLLIKEHKKTGLKYLCKHSSETLDDCFYYNGSGTYWKKHIKKHGSDLKTTCLFVTEDKNEFKKVAIEYSIKFDVVNSKEWANLTAEEGQGGNTVIDYKEHSRKTSEGIKKSINYPNLLKHLQVQTKISQPLAAKAAKQKLTGIKKTEEHKKNMSGKRPHVDQTGSKNNNAKKIKTPFGIFNSIREASQQIEGHTYRMIGYRLKNDVEWSFM